MKIRQPWKGFYLNGLTWSPSEIFICNMMGQTLSEGETLDHGALVTLGFVHSFFSGRVACFLLTRLRTY